MAVKLRDSVYTSLNAVCEATLEWNGWGYPAELAELSDLLQAEDLIDKTDVAECEDAAKEEGELLAQVMLVVKEWRRDHIKQG